jgi:hypothetical protein
MMAAFFLGEALAQRLYSDCFEDEESVDGRRPGIELDVKLTDCLPEFLARIDEVIGTHLAFLSVLELARKLRTEGTLRVADVRQLVRDAARRTHHCPSNAGPLLAERDGRWPQRGRLRLFYGLRQIELSEGPSEKSAS